MRFHASAGVQQQDSEAFTFRIEIGILRDMHPPVLRGGVGRVAKLHLFGRRAFTERYDFVFVRLAFEFEGLHQVFETRERFCRGHVHRKFWKSVLDLRRQT